MQRFWALIDDSGSDEVSAPRFDLAISASILAVAITWILRSWLDVELPFLFCIGAVIFASLQGGFATGAIATVCSISGTTLFASSGVALVTARNVGIVLLFCTGLAISGEMTQRLRRRERRAAARMFRREQTLQTMFEDSPAAMLVADSRDTIAAANEAAAALFGMSCTNLIGLRLSAVLPLGTVRDAGVCSVEMGPGRSLHLNVLAKPLPIKGQTYRMIYIRNETDAMVAAENLSVTQRELYRMARATTLNQFGSSIAHELNQPMAFVANYVGAAHALITRNPPDLDIARGALDDALKQIFRASAVLKKLKEFVGRRAPTLSWIDMSSLLIDVEKLGRMAVREAGADLHIVFPDEPTEILCDAVQLQQVMLNLVVNAVDAVRERPDRRIVVRTWRKPSEDRLIVAVEDSGCGLPDGDGHRLFAPFRSTKPEGVGIGLAICRGIVEAHGGHIWCDAITELGGARFLFTVPSRLQGETGHAA